MNDEGMVMQNMEIMLTMKNIQKTIGQMQSPLGRDAKNPGRSCRDIYLAAIANGESPKQGQDIRWVDPNGGSREDAIEVLCKFDTQETCVIPSQSVIANGTHGSGQRGHRYHAEMVKGEPVSYLPPTESRKAHADYLSQLTFLRLLSTYAKQRVEVSCFNQLVTEGHPVKLRGTGDAVYTSNSYNVIEDNCSDDGDRWGRAVVEVYTSRVARLPLTDVSMYHSTVKDAQYGAKFMPVCFK